MRISNPIKNIFVCISLSLLISSNASSSSSPNLQTANKLTSITMCAFLLMGTNGPEYDAIVNYKIAAMGLGVDLKIKFYMNEKIVMEELKAGVCDIANMTGMQALNFNRFTGSLHATGGIPTYEHLELVLSVLSRPSAAKYMRQGEYEIMGIQPAGAVYLFTNDRNIEGIADFAGKKMGILESMPEMRQMVLDMGMTPVSSTLTNVFQKFNNNVVDITAGPAIIYQPMEIQKGLEPVGGILQEPVMQANLQFIGRWEKFPPGFGQKSRELFMSNFDESLKLFQQAENAIPKKWWIPIPNDSMHEFNSQLRTMRLAARAAGIYEPKALTLLRKVRCKVDKTRPECTSEDAE